MQKLHETCITTPVAEMQKAFQDMGYLFIRSFFSTELIFKIRKTIISILESEGWGRWKSDVFVAVEPVNRINSPAFYKCIGKLMESELLHEIADYPQLGWILSAILGEPIYPHPRKMVRITYPFTMNPKDRTPPHQDIVYVKGEQDTFTVWIPLGDYPTDQGGLEVAPTTHKLGLLPTQANSEGRFGCTAIEEHVKDFTWNNAHYKPGDLLIMHSLTLHQSGINNTNEFRLSLDCRFSSALKTINEDQLLPPYFPHVSPWETLSVNWKNPDRFKMPKTMYVHEKSKELTDVMATNSRFTK